MTTVQFSSLETTSASGDKVNVPYTIKSASEANIEQNFFCFKFIEVLRGQLLKALRSVKSNIHGRDPVL